ncbi:3-deoxy-7-phosphoheptulonate synthase [Mesoterricola silvestris]|uniref:3-deoxy-7-phosphoheptulonate synthase n=1 Tax=Mesoterricola silvestris TaxID=2927979 RepID=A0AA48K8Y6_9BACT|nr:3-deoxy-7-phosphoheptulonate synthase [Mesoterricola silvestris]BDU72590.1 3-deoxy-7-phosphoheptulonate synthase [Mesoterricola silvestris]
MLILMDPGATAEQVRTVMDVLEGAGVRAYVQDSPAATSILAPHASKALKADRIEPLEGVSRVVPITSPFKLASADAAPGRTIVDVRGVKVGGRDLTLMAGPCGVESREQLFTVARYVAESGARLLRAGAHKPRTSPYAFQGLGEEGLELLDQARREFDLGIVTEATEVETFDGVERVADLVQIGARNMQNFALLKRAGRSSRPVLLKRGPAATLEEWLFAAEYVLSEGNRNVILCERGIRTWSAHARNTLDVSVIPAAKALTHLPVIADPSHATGRRDLVIPCARAAVAAGADGIIVETHCQPSQALSDGPQALLPSDFLQMVGQVTAIRDLLVKDSPGATFCF